MGWGPLEQLMEVPGRVGSLGRVPGVFFFFSSSSFFRRAFFLVGAGFDIKWDSPARKKVKDENSIPKKDQEGNIDFGNWAVPRGRKGAGCQAAARGDVDGSRQI